VFDSSYRETPSGTQVMMSSDTQKDKNVRTCGDIELCNSRFINTVEVLDQRTQGVTVRSDQNRLSRSQLGNNLRVVVRKDTLQGRLERFRKVLRELSIGVTRVATRVVLAGLVHSRWRDVVTTTPDKNLILAVLVDRLLLVQSL
jgi:hypothetical protein